MEGRRPLDLTITALVNIQAIVEDGFKKRQVAPQVLRGVLGVIGETLRRLRAAPSAELGPTADAQELQRRLGLLLAEIEPEMRQRLAAAEVAAGRDAGWLSAGVDEEPTEGGAAAETGEAAKSAESPEVQS